MLIITGKKEKKEEYCFSVLFIVVIGKKIHQNFKAFLIFLPMKDFLAALSVVSIFNLYFLNGP